MLLLPAPTSAYGGPTTFDSNYVPLNNAIAGGETCPEMNPFCPNDGTTYDFYLAGTEAQTTCSPSTNCNFGCLASHPGEQWLYLTISSPGNMVFSTTSTSDHDYAIWG